VNGVGGTKPKTAPEIFQESCRIASERGVDIGSLRDFRYMKSTRLRHHLEVSRNE
jgi:hypothetical protein